MEPSLFDELTKALATSTSRRQALKTIAATTIGGILGLGRLGTAFGAPKCHRNGLGCDTNSNCCSNYCANGKCTCPPAPACNDTCPCSSGQTCCNGTCCGSGQVCLCNGSCATPCSIGCPAGAICLEDESGAFYCGNLNGTLASCANDCACPPGQFCFIGLPGINVCGGLS